ncbi:endothelin-converting enzyme 2-like isoform X2 [Ornithodoros turicata]|uniref:endothelin-converting enzyme 2-like isoform X2 n=1 Tax=Ornithodoros turicata TaxID=34597 RepID=UPI00313905EF
MRHCGERRRRRRRMKTAEKKQSKKHGARKASPGPSTGHSPNRSPGPSDRRSAGQSPNVLTGASPIGSTSPFANRFTNRFDRNRGQPAQKEASRTGSRKRKPQKQREYKIEVAEVAEEDTRSPSPASIRTEKKSISLSRTIIVICVVTAVFLLLLSLVFSGTFKRLFYSEGHTGCRSSQCLEAYDLFQTMRSNNISACKDFYQYSCGGWHATGSNQSSAMEMLERMLSDSLNRTFYLKALEVSQKNRSYNVLTFYKSCYAFFSVERTFKELREGLLPRLNLSLEKSMKDPLSIFNEAVHMTLSRGIDTFFSISIVQSDGKYLVVITPGKSLERKLLNDAESGDRSHFKQYMHDFMATIDPGVLDGKTRTQIMLLDEKFGNITKSSGSVVTRRVTVGRLPTVPEMMTEDSWLEALRRNQPTKNLEEDSTVAVDDMEIVQEITEFLFSGNTSYMSLYLMMQATGTFLKLHFNAHVAPQHLCTMLSCQAFTADFTVLAAKEHIGESRTKHFHFFFNNARNQLLRSLSTGNWLDNGTLYGAATRMKAIALKTPAFEAEALSSGVPVMKPDFFSNYVAMLKYRKEQDNRHPKTDDERDNDENEPQCNVLLGSAAIFHDEKKEIIVPILFMMPPLYFDVDGDDFINYSIVGRNLVELLTMSFIGGGDEDPPWWSNQVSSAFYDNTLCYGRQFTTLLGNAVGMTAYVRKRLYASLRAVSQAAASLGDIFDEKERQLFFGRVCQTRCRRVFDAEPAPIPARPVCHFAVQNVPLFFDTFKCAANDTMRPQITCKPM